MSTIDKTAFPALTAPIDGRGWLLYTISCLALGIDPWADPMNRTTIEEVIWACEHARDLGLDLRQHGMDFEVAYRIFEPGTATHWLYLAPAGASAPTFAYQWCESAGGSSDEVWARHIQAAQPVAASSPFADARPMVWASWTTND